MSSRPRTSGMTRWSRRDSVQRSGNADHWTKLRVRSKSFIDTQSGDSVKVTETGSKFHHEVLLKVHREPYNFGKGESVDSELSSIDHNATSPRSLAALPGAYRDVNLTRSGLQKQWLNNCYQRRARDGFRYWVINKPTPTKFGKYGLGTYKTMLGVGMAPRT